MGGIFHAWHVSHGHAFSPCCDAPDLSVPGVDSAPESGP